MTDNNDPMKKVIDFSEVPDLDELRGLQVINNLFEEMIENQIDKGHIDDSPHWSEQL